MICQVFALTECYVIQFLARGVFVTVVQTRQHAIFERRNRIISQVLHGQCFVMQFLARGFIAPIVRPLWYFALGRHCYPPPITTGAKRSTVANCLYLQLGKSGVMNPDAFMNRLSGCMNSRRAILVDEAFDRLDIAGKEYLTLEEVRNVLLCPYATQYSTCLDKEWSLAKSLEFLVSTFEVIG